MRRLVYIIPAIAFVVIAAFLAAGLWESEKQAPDELPSMLVNQPVPRDMLPALAGSLGFLPADFAKGHVTVLNMFASWCVPCRAEAPGLSVIKGMKGVTLYGIAWKDSAKNAQDFLSQVGNPYDRIDLDTDGRAGIDWGITGVPETFVIDGTGVVRLRYAGPLVGDALTTIVLPAIERARPQG